MKKIKIVFDDGEVVYWTLGKQVREEYCFESRKTKWIELIVCEKKGKYAGISEIELFNDVQMQEGFYFIKIIKNNNFIYAASENDLREYEVYGYQKNRESKLIDKNLLVSKKYQDKNGNWWYRVSLKETPEIYDEILLDSSVIIKKGIERTFRDIETSIKDMKNLLQTQVAKVRMLVGR